MPCRPPTHILTLALLAGSLTWLLAPIGLASATTQPTAQATRRVIEGRRAYDRADYAAAAALLDSAFADFPAPTVALYAARAHARRGHLLDARQRYEQALAADVNVGQPAAQAAARRDAEHELHALRARIPTLTVTVRHAPDENAVVAVDGQPWQPGTWERHPLDPGDHTIEVRVAGQRRQRAVQLAEGSHPQIAFDLRDDRGDGPDLLAYGTLGAGLVLLAVAGGSSLAAAATCAGGRCDTKSALSSYDSLRTTATIAFYSGLAATTAGVVWVAWPRAERASAANGQVAVSVTPTSAALWGTF